MSTNAYDLLAPDYAAYARTRAAYCAAVDRLVLEWRPARVGALLDVGSGDGVRAVRLATAMSAPRVVLSDPAPAMAAQCDRLGVSDVWRCAAEALPGGEPEFDVITCLWNVLACVDGARRVEALARMRARLANQGRLFLDVHNRYNAATAGRWRVCSRMVRDMVRPSGDNGSVAFTWNVNGRSIPARGYLFAPGEMGRLIDEAALRVVRRTFVDYTTGEARGPWSGQMVYELARR